MNILVISDVHEPYRHPDTFPFLDALVNVYDPDKVVCIGDESDIHTVPWHTAHPDAYAPQQEYELALQAFHEEWLPRFPKLKICKSNHGNRYDRIMKAGGIPGDVRKKLTLNDIWDVPNTWEWADRHIVDGIHFEHGDKGKSFSARARQGLSYSTVQGHRHLEGGVIWYRSGEGKNRFAAQTGCIIDFDAPAFGYSHFEPVLGTLVIEDRVPVFCPMKLDKHGRWTGKL